MKIAIIVFVFLSLLAAAAAAADTFTARAIAVHDGDTLTILHNGRKEHLRLYGIDAPELAQFYGTSATLILARAVSQTTITVTIINRDRYSRSVATITLPNGSNVNQMLVAQGAAWWYQAYAPKDFPLERAQTAAKAARLGLWQHLEPCPPWAFRAAEKHRTSKNRSK